MGNYLINVLIGNDITHTTFSNGGSYVVMKIESEYNSPFRVKVATATSAFIGTSLVVTSLAKGKISNIPKLQIGIKEAFAISGGSIFGGFIGGALSDDRRQIKYKARETSNQIIGNTTVPYTCLMLANKMSKGMPKPIRTVIAGATIFFTTFLGHNIADKVNDNIFEEKRKYKVHLKDFISDFDDVIFASSTVLKNKTLYKIISCLSPFTYTTLGIMAGTRHKKLDTEI